MVTKLTKQKNCRSPTTAPTTPPTPYPTKTPTIIPTPYPTTQPTLAPTAYPTVVPTVTPTEPPTVPPTAFPTGAPTKTPTTGRPTVAPTTCLYDKGDRREHCDWYWTCLKNENICKAPLEACCDAGEPCPRIVACAINRALAGDPSKLFKMEGARGRLAQDRLDTQLREHPAVIVAEFEDAVRREAPPEDPAETDITLGQLQRAWRQTVPAKEHPLVVRVTEALLHIYHHLRAGRTQLGMARTALLIAAMEQGVRDNGRMEKRADVLACMPPPPLSLYHAHSTEERQQLKDDKKGLGTMARLVGATRATTARAVYLENAGA